MRSLVVNCSNVTCRHEKIVNVDAYGDDLFVPSFGPRMRASATRTFGPIGMSKPSLYGHQSAVVELKEAANRGGLEVFEKHFGANLPSFFVIG